MRDKIKKIVKKVQKKKFGFAARKGEADRHIPATRSKHLLAGKRGMGTSRSR